MDNSFTFQLYKQPGVITDRANYFGFKKPRDRHL
jgi:hypothetical protein